MTTFTLSKDELPSFMRKDNQVKPAFYIFTKDEQGNSIRIGAAFAHKKGKGLNLVIHDKRYSAFPPKSKPELADE